MSEKVKQLEPIRGRTNRTQAPIQRPHILRQSVWLTRNTVNVNHPSFDVGGDRSPLDSKCPGSLPFVAGEGAFWPRSARSLAQCFLTFFAGSGAGGGGVDSAGTSLGDCASLRITSVGIAASSTTRLSCSRT